jgi:DNA-binding transcriptional LysR family regulator
MPLHRDCKVKTSMMGEALSEPSGLIRISTLVFTCETLLAGWLAEFINGYPRVQVLLPVRRTVLTALVRSPYEGGQVARLALATRLG